MAFITYSSTYLEKYNIADNDQTTAYIAAAGKAIEKYCNREFESSERDRVLVTQGSTVFLPAYPVTSIARVCTDQVAVLTLACTATPSSYTVTSTGLVLTSYTNGTRTTQTLLFASFPTLSQLVAGLSGVWSGSVSGGYGSYPSTDLVSGVSGTSSMQLPIWRDASNYYCDLDRGIVSVGYSTSHWFLTDGTSCPTQVRCVWTGGYTSIPEDIQRATAEIVGTMADTTNSDAIVSENVGYYSYTLDASRMANLPISTKQILNSYKDRNI